MELSVNEVLINHVFGNGLPLTSFWRQF